jgi:plasmid maintenance system antidote protein VapI
MSDSTKGLSDDRRLQTVLDLKHISANKLANLLKYKSPSSVYHVIEGRNKLSTDMVEGIIKIFPDISYQFLKNAKGEPILQNQAQIQVQKNLFGSEDATSKQDQLLKTLEKKEDYKSDPLTYNVNFQLNELIELQKKQNDFLSELISLMRESQKSF